MATLNSDLRTIVGQLLIVGFDGLSAPRSLLERIRRGEVGGVIVFTRNYETPEQLLGLTEALRQAANGLPPLLISVDQEGGRVQRIRDPLVQWPTMRTLGERDDLEYTEKVGEILGRQLAALGFNLNFAPVLDVVQSDENTVIGDRSFGAEPQRVAQHALALARGLGLAGVIPCGKHFPGHGGPVADSHHVLPVERRSEATLRQWDLLPFAAAIAAKLPLLMSAHLQVNAWDDACPATFSRRICTDLLRGELAYDGVLVSDDLEMGAIMQHHTMADAALMAMGAGVDLLLICHRDDRQQAAFEALLHRGEGDSSFRERLEVAASRVQRLKEEMKPLSALGRGELRSRLAGLQQVAVKTGLV